MPHILCLLLTKAVVRRYRDLNSLERLFFFFSQPCLLALIAVNPLHLSGKTARELPSTPIQKKERMGARHGMVIGDLVFLSKKKKHMHMLMERTERTHV